MTIMSFVFSIGAFIVAIGAVEALNLPATVFTFIGLIIAVVGSGSTRANLTAFGANQYQGQPENLKLYFSVQIVFLKAGSLLGRSISPILREDVKCFGMESCYPLAFGLPAIAMLIALMVIVCGKSFYIHKPPTENIFAKIFGCIIFAIKKNFKEGREKSHWLDSAREKYDQELLDAVKKILRILIIFIPIPFYWAVYMQQGSRWIFQATRMDGDLGWYIIKPDQMIALNPIFAIILMPACNYIFFPFMSKLSFNSLLHRIIVGGFLCCIAFSLAIFIEIKIQNDFVTILWLLPQFAVLALSENFLFTSLLNFAYAEAPSNMKSVMTACVFVTIALGNFVIIFISGFKLFESQVVEFAFFIVLLLLDLIVLIILTIKLKFEN